MKGWEVSTQFSLLVVPSSTYPSVGGALSVSYRVLCKKEAGTAMTAFAIVDSSVSVFIC